jgi:ABC-type antimicrobial peptide transport system permease subunit
VPVQKAISALQDYFKKYDPGQLFQYRFVDQEFEKKFVSEELISKLTNLFTALAIFICLISLSGMTSFTIEKRFREIGIRKVMGASVSQILALIANEFLFLLLLSLLITVPLTWWVIAIWLRKYTFHIEVSFLIFLGVSVVILLTTMAVVCLNSIKVAVSNPVDSLRTE